ncbi:MAG: ATP-binding protein, partial [Eubacteriales bacterium]|nr:ATP-binding protein [Eubacteriales bacterium]
MYLFDYNVMQQYGLDVSLLPEEAGVFYAPQSFWKTYSNQIIISLLVVLIIGLSIAALTIRRAERKVKEKNRELTVANRAKTDFLAHMSHDLRTPMNAILSTARLLQDRTDPAEIRADVEQIEQSGKYLLDLINDSLDMSRIEPGRLELHPAPISSEELFRGILTTAQMLCDQKGVRLKLELPPIAHGQWAAVEADASRVEQVFINLISNAVKFTPEGGCVTLHMETLAMTEETVSDRYVIADTGIGMSEAFQQHLFEPFSQERRAHTDYNNGTGLGLAIVKQIVDLLGGTIQIESRENAGTRVTLELSYPRYHGQLAAAADQADLSVLRGKRVLLCEDHPVNAQIAIRLLAKQGMVVEHAENGQIGLEMFSQSPERYYDLVLMDIRMPIMNGLEAARAIRALPNRHDAAAVPIVAMTANAFDSDIQQSLSAGMNAHLAKPIEPSKLYEELARQIQGR